MKAGRPATIDASMSHVANKHSNNLHFGIEKRFKPDPRLLQNDPGPGNYNDSNKWNKRTYNLKFLNFKAGSTQASSVHHPKSYSMNNTMQANDSKNGGGFMQSID